MALDAAIVRVAQHEALVGALRQRGLHVYHDGVPSPLSPAQCVLLTDSLDADESARGAGLVCLAISNRHHEFRSAGARAVYKSTDQLLACLDDALELASPGPAHLTTATIESLMRRALDVARQ